MKIKEYIDRLNAARMPERRIKRARYASHKDNINAHRQAYYEAHKHGDDGERIHCCEVCWELHSDEILAEIAKYEDDANVRLCAEKKLEFENENNRIPRTT